MRLGLVLISFSLLSISFSPTAWADEVAKDDFAKIVCDPLEIANDYIKSNTVADLWSSIATYRTRINTFIQNAQASLEEARAKQDITAMAVTCGMVHDATLGFSRPCYTDDGSVIDLKNVQIICESISNQNIQQ